MKVKEGIRTHNVWFHPYAIGPNTRIQRGTHWPMFTLKDLKIKLNHQNVSVCLTQRRIRIIGTGSNKILFTRNYDT